MLHYLFDYNQNVLVKLNVSCKELILIHYINHSLTSGKMLVRRFDNRSFVWLSYKKIIDDLPILDMQIRQLRRTVASLAKRNILLRVVQKGLTYFSVNHKYLVQVMLDL